MRPSSSFPLDEENRSIVTAISNGIPRTDPDPRSIKEKVDRIYRLHRIGKITAILDSITLAVLLLLGEDLEYDFKIGATFLYVSWMLVGSVIAFKVLVLPKQSANKNISVQHAKLLAIWNCIAIK